MGIGGGDIKFFAPIGVNEYGAMNKEATAGVLGGSDVQQNITQADGERLALLPLPDGTPRSESCSRGAVTFLFATMVTLFVATVVAYNHHLRDATRHGWAAVPHIHVLATASSPVDNQNYVEFQTALRRSGVPRGQIDAKLRRDERLDWKQLPVDKDKVDYAYKSVYAFWVGDRSRAPRRGGGLFPFFFIFPNLITTHTKITTTTTTHQQKAPNDRVSVEGAPASYRTYRTKLARE